MENVSQVVFGIKEILVALVGIGTAIGAIYGWIVRPFKKQAELDKEQSKKIDSIITSLEDLRKQFDEHQTVYVRDRLQSLHERHVNELGWAQAEEKRRIVDWYDSYSAKGYNHLQKTYVNDIMSLPERPNK